MLRDIQSRFRLAVVGGDNAPLAGLVAADGSVPLARRIAVHRNTFFGSLGDAMENAFPVVRRLVGDAFFRAAARAFVEAAPPTAPDLAAYGAGFAVFLADFAPAGGLAYLPDVARLEWARVEATFAADADPLNPAALADAPPADLPRLVLTLHPSARLVASAWPVQSLWEIHQIEPVGSLPDDAAAETVLVVRPADRMVARRLGPGDAAFVAGIAQGATLGEAIALAQGAEPAFDLRSALAAHLQTGTFSGADVPIHPPGATA